MDEVTDTLNLLPAGVFCTGAPCSHCGRSLPTYQDPETSDRLCLTCLELAVDAAENEAENAWADLINFCDSRAECARA